MVFFPLRLMYPAREGIDLTYEGITTRRRTLLLDRGQRAEGIDLTYEGITTPCNTPLIAYSSRGEGIDLTYEGITTPSLLRPVCSTTLLKELT